MPRLLQIAHGYPPRQNAGTEQYARRVADGLRARGWDVLTVAAAPEPGARQYALTRSERLVRIANNTPFANLRRGESDPAIDRILTTIEREFRPDVVHVQHLQFLSATWRAHAPVVWTLHDAWGWCAAGGLLLRDGAPCPGPGAACPTCASGWAKDTPAVTRLTAVAGTLSRFVDPSRLHAAWRRLPGGIRARATSGPVPPLTASNLTRRDDTLRAFAARCRTIVSPSRWLANEAARHGLSVVVLPHGVDAPQLPHRPDGPFVFLGTLAPHKGPHLVRAAADLAGVPLRIHGPPGPDPTYVVPNDGPVPAESVPALLTGARALVLGSIWPENAPLVVLEARAVGCPVIAPAIGGLPEIVEPGVDGWLYPPGDVAALVKCLREAAGHTPPVRPPPTFAAHLDGLCRLYG